MSKFLRCYDVIPRGSGGYQRRNHATSYIFQTTDPLVAARAASAKMDQLLMDGGHSPSALGVARVFDVAPVGLDVPMSEAKLYRVTRTEEGYKAEPLQGETKGKTE